MYKEEKIYSVNIPKIQPRRLTNPLLYILIALLVYMILISTPSAASMIKLSFLHFYIVTISSGIAAISAIGMGISGYRLRNPQVLFMSLSFLSLTMLFGLHGLTTPGVLMEFHPITGVAAQLSLSIMSFWLFLSSLPSDNSLIIYLIRVDRRLVPIWTLALVSFVTIAMLMPEIGDRMPVNQIPIKWFTGAFTIGLASTAGYRFWRSYRYARFPLQISLAHSAGLIVSAQVIITTSGAWTAGWWWYHILLLAAVVLPVIGLLQQYKRGDSLVLSVRGLFSTDPAERLEAGISPSVRALVQKAETQDAYMAGHSRRVAQAALKLGAALKLSPEELRALAQGAILHDIGKLEVPGDLLNIPGELTPEQRAVIEKHPQQGYEMCSQLGFMHDELAMIRYHHERLDGSGYPEGQEGNAIPALARILAIVDVYDALTSDRAYRPTWSQADAIKHLQENRGTLFETDWVDTWVELVQSDGRV